MDWKLLETWEIEKDSDPKKICDVLEDRQLTLLQMRRNENDSEKKAEIADELKNIEKQLKLAKQEVKKKAEETVVSEDTSFDEKAEASTSKDTETAANEASNPQPVKTVQSTAEPASSQSAGIGADLGMVPVGDNKQQLQKGISEYSNGNFSAAYETFNMLAQNGEPEAEFYLSQLYSKGKGTYVDKDKANYWLKKSADHEYVSAQYLYALTLFSNRSEDDPLPAEGLRYLAGAAEQDYVSAMKKYIELILKDDEDIEYCEGFNIQNAIRYASKLQSVSSDQYDIDLYRNKEEQLKDILATWKKNSFELKVLNILRFLGPALFVIGFLYLLGGVHPDEWDNNAFLKVFPNASKFLIIPFRPFWMFVLTTMTVNGQFGLELIALSYVCKYIYDAKNELFFDNVLVIVSKIIVAVIIVWHLILMAIEGISFSEGIKYFALAIVVSCFWGYIISKLVLVVYGAQTDVKRIVLAIVILAGLITVNLFAGKISSINEMVNHGGNNDAENNAQSIAAEIVNKDISDCQSITVSSIEADSVLVSSKGNRYEPEYMIDGDTDTSWQEGEEGAGEGTTFNAGFEGEEKVDYIVIYNGKQQSENQYANNNRICSLNISVDGQSTNVELADTMEPQIIRLEGADTVSNIQFEIESVYSGNKYNDTCVAELKFLCE